MKIVKPGSVTVNPDGTLLISNFTFDAQGKVPDPKAMMKVASVWAIKAIMDAGSRTTTVSEN